MRRHEIVHGAKQVTDALRKSGMEEAIRLVLDHSNRGPDRSPQAADRILGAYKRYVLAAHYYNDAARKIADIFGLSPLEETSWISSAPTADPGSIAPLWRAITYGIEYLPKLTELLQYDAASERTVELNAQSGRALLTVVLPEQDRDYSRPQRVADLLLAVASLYEAAALLEHLPDNTLGVASCDSGSDESFDLLGVAKLIAIVKELLLSVWDRAVYFRELQLSQRLSLVSQSLPILEKVAQLETDQAIGREEAEQVRRKILHGVSQFLECGAIIPEMTARGNVDPRQLMAAEPKLLTAASELSSEPSEDLTDDEKRTLDDLQKRAGRTGPPKPT